MVSIQQPVNRYRSSFFDFSMVRKSDNVIMEMQFPDTCFLTTHLPGTYQFLCQHAPSVLECQCFNQENLAFADEVTNTEMAHLFEHILLDRLCFSKSADTDALYEGETEWDWRISPVGSFTVTVAVPPSDHRHLALAINDTIRLMEDLYSTLSK